MVGAGEEVVALSLASVLAFELLGSLMLLGSPSSLLIIKFEPHQKKA